MAEEEAASAAAAVIAAMDAEGGGSRRSERGSGGGEGGGATFLTETKVHHEEEEEDDFPEYEEYASGAGGEAEDTAMLRLQQKVRVMDDALEYMKREYKARMEAVSKKEEKLRADEKRMADMLETFRDFIDDNDAKKAKAKARAETERAECVRLEAQKAELERELRELEVTREERRGRLARLGRYADFLRRVVDASEADFREPADILARYETLTRTEAGQEKDAKRARAETEQVRLEVARLEDEGQARSLRLTAELQRCQARLEELRVRGSGLRLEQEAAESAARQGVVEAGQVEMSVRNLYTRCLREAPNPASLRVEKPRDAEPAHVRKYLDGCLEAVGRRLEDLGEIVRGRAAWERERAVEKRREAAAAARQVAEERAREEAKKAAEARRAKARVAAGGTATTRRRGVGPPLSARSSLRELPSLSSVGSRTSHSRASLTPRKAPKGKDIDHDTDTDGLGRSDSKAVPEGYGKRIARNTFQLDFGDGGEADDAPSPSPSSTWLSPPPSTPSASMRS